MNEEKSMNDTTREPPRAGALPEETQAAPEQTADRIFPAGQPQNAAGKDGAPTADFSDGEKGNDPEETVEIVGVRFRSAGKSYYFNPGRLKLRVGDPVIVETARGIEFGTVNIANRRVPLSAVTPPLRIVMRQANENDRERNRRNREQEIEAVRICREKAARHKLEMDLVSAEYTFDNSKLLFYFTAEGRVDFRDLVRDLASTFHTRIELRQIGIRDEAKFLGGLGACGRPYCCSTFLPDFTQVSIKMAKEQNFSLNSAKISGACGRLMCCLRFEHESYEAALKTTPGIGSLVSTPEGEGVVIETRPLLQLVKVRLTDRPETPHLFSCGDVSVLRTAKMQKKEQNPPDKNAPVTDAEAPREREKPGEKAKRSPEKSESRPADSDEKATENSRNGRPDHRQGTRQNGRNDNRRKRPNGHPGNRSPKPSEKNEGAPADTPEAGKTE